MADDKLDKVIKGLTECIADLDCDDCPYENECFNANDDRQYGEQMMRDALELLKKQAPKPVWYETNGMTGLPISHCPSCNEIIKQYAYGDIRKTYYCQYCGQAVKWE